MVTYEEYLQVLERLDLSADMNYLVVNYINIKKYLIVALLTYETWQSV